MPDKSVFAPPCTSLKISFEVGKSLQPSAGSSVSATCTNLSIYVNLIGCKGHPCQAILPACLRCPRRSQLVMQLAVQSQSGFWNKPRLLILDSPRQSSLRQPGQVLSMRAQSQSIPILSYPDAGITRGSDLQALPLRQQARFNLLIGKRFPWDYFADECRCENG